MSSPSFQACACGRLNVRVYGREFCPTCTVQDCDAQICAIHTAAWEAVRAFQGRHESLAYDLDRIGEEIAQRGETWISVCRQAGVSDATANKIRNGGRNLRPMTVARIAIALGIEPSEVIALRRDHQIEKEVSA